MTEQRTRGEWPDNFGGEEIGRSKILHISRYPQKLRTDPKVNGQ